jgi:hypothetical protein
MAINTSDSPPLHNDYSYSYLGATKLSDCSHCTSSKATKVLTAVAKMQPQSESPLFRLPPELRRMIYGYVFAAKEPASHDQGMTISEAQSAKPATDLLLTCQMIFQDAHDTFEVARTHFWTNTVFSIHLESSQALFFSRIFWDNVIDFESSPVIDSVNKLQVRELQRMQKVVIAVSVVVSVGQSMETLTPEWRLSSCCRQVHGVHKLDWILSHSALFTPQAYLSRYTMARMGKQGAKSESLVNLLEYLGSAYGAR